MEREEKLDLSCTEYMNKFLKSTVLIASIKGRNSVKL